MSFVTDFFSSLFQRPEHQKIETTTPGQQEVNDLIQQAITQGTGPIAGATQFDPQSSANRFNQAVSQPLITQFNEEILPGITGQFRGAGLGKSTFAGQAAARAGEGLERQLATGLSQFQTAEKSQADQNLLKLISMFTGTPQFGLTPPTRSPIEEMLVAFANKAGQGAASKFGG